MMSRKPEPPGPMHDEVSRKLNDRSRIPGTKEWREAHRGAEASVPKTPIEEAGRRHDELHRLVDELVNSVAKKVLEGAGVEADPLAGLGRRALDILDSLWAEHGCELRRGDPLAAHIAELVAAYRKVVLGEGR